MGSQERPELVVVAVPSSLLVQGHDEHVGGHEVGEHRPRSFDSCDRRAQLCVEGVEHRRLDEELDERGWQAGQHLADQEVADGAIGVGERLQELLMVDSPLQGDGRQLGARGPSLREVVQAGQFVAGQADVVQREEFGQLIGGEAEIVGPHLQQFTAQAQPGQRHRRIGPGADGETEAVGERLGERGQQCRIGRRQMKVVHHDHTRRADRGELVRYCGRRVVDVVGAAALQEHVGVVGYARPPRRERREQPRHEACRLGICRITGQPGHTITVFGGPHRKHRRLAVTGRCRHERQPIILVQAGVQTGSWQQRPARARNRQLRGCHHGRRTPSLPGQLRGLT